MNPSVDSVFLFNFIYVFVIDVLERRDGVAHTACFISLSSKLKSATMFKFVNLLCPILLVQSLFSKCDRSLCSFHGINLFESLLDLILRVVIQHLWFLFKEDAEDEPIYNEPPIAPEETKQPLDLVKRYDLSENTHDPVLAENHNINVHLIKVVHEIG